MKTPEQVTTIIDPSLQDFTTQIIELARDGWELDEDNPPRMVSWMYEAHMWRNPTDIQRAQAPKLSKAEILTKARAAKAAKAEAAAAEAEAAEAEANKLAVEPTAESDDSPY